jgi:hypothetical protein
MDLDEIDIQSGPMDTIMNFKQSSPPNAVLLKLIVILIQNVQSLHSLISYTKTFGNLI